jgi:acetate kinase
MTEQFSLGIHPPIRESGDLEGTPGCILEGPNGSVKIEKGSYLRLYVTFT